MGGCRCCFRQCPVASERNKGMHFFKFPIKHQERFQQWVKLAGVEHFLACKDIEISNKVVCARHFPDTHFMNYKRNRLTISALPSLHRLNEEYALDYSNDADSPTLIKLPPVSRPHLISPPGFPCTMIFTAADRKMAEEIIRTNGQNTERTGKKLCAQKRPSLLPTKTVPDVKKARLNENNLRDDNCIVYYELQKDAIKEKHFVLKDNACELIDDISEIENNPKEQILPEIIAPSITNSVQYLEQQSSTKATQCSLGESSNDHFKNIQDELAKELETSEKSKQSLNILNEKIGVFQSKLRKVSAENEQLKAQLRESEKHNSDLSNKLLDLQSQNKALEEHKRNLETQYMEMWKQKQQDQVTSSIPKQQKSPSQHSSQQLTKGQLFNGIKKYLSQTMVALLRIQISSGSEEREWKPDERRLAVDLMGLGEQVYKYFTDEWVIRLPPLRQVRQWQNEVGAFDEEDDI